MYLHKFMERAKHTSAMYLNQFLILRFNLILAKHVDQRNASCLECMPEGDLARKLATHDTH